MRAWLWGVAGLILLAPCGPALAWQAEVRWPSFFRDGPDRRNTVLDEADRGDFVDVLSCDDSWCKVVSEGSVVYLEKQNLTIPDGLPQKPASQAASDPACFESQLTGFGKGETWRFCPQK